MRLAVNIRAEPISDKQTAVGIAMSCGPPQFPKTIVLLQNAASIPARAEIAMISAPLTTMAVPTIVLWIYFIHYVLVGTD